MKILILGAKGMLGQQLVRAFSDMGEVTAWDKEEIDLAKADETSRAITALMPDVLVNAAAYNNVDKAEEEEDLAKQMNGNLVGALADMCQILAITMVHYSTDYVFDGTKQDGYVETDAPNPQGAYARSKHLGERLLKMSGAEYYLIRTSRLFGPAAASSLAKKSFVDTVLDLAKTRDTIDLVDEELSNPTYAPDLATATAELVRGKKPFGIYHVTNAGSCTWYGFGKKVIELAGLTTKVNPVPGSAFPRPAPRPPYSVLRSTKLPAMRPWEEALKEYLGSRQ